MYWLELSVSSDNICFLDDTLMTLQFYVASAGKEIYSMYNFCKGKGTIVTFVK